MLLITVWCWKMHLQSRALWWKKNNIFVVCFRFSKFFHLTELLKLPEFFKFNCFNLRNGNTNLYVHDFTSSKKIIFFATLNYLHFDETVMLLNGNWNFLYFMGIKLHIVHDNTLVAEETENLNHLYSLNIAT